MASLHRRKVLFGTLASATIGIDVLSQAHTSSPPYAPGPAPDATPLAAAPADHPILSAAVRLTPPPATEPLLTVPPDAVPAPPTVPATPLSPRWQRYAVALPPKADRPAITIVIDDLGVMHAATERVVAMPGPLTLSWFPFAHNVAAQVAAAIPRGHEMTLHMPMQSYGLTTAWTGPDPLRIDLPDAVNLARLHAAMDAVPNTVGLNNHMGSVATRNPALMALVARETKARNMLFLDSVVVAHSYGYSEARDAGVPAAARDIFIDHSNDPREIRDQLAQIEAMARRRGHVIAIGHPWPHTIAALEEWLPTLNAKGFSMWPLSAMVARRNGLKMPGRLTA
jgi:polysaccharide deacetylase 2 family uncharacterized protein YibQ